VPDHDVADQHHLGLLHDLATTRARTARALAPVRLQRRHALRLLGGAGLGAVLLAACGGSGSAGGVSSTTPTSTGATGGTGGTGTGEAIPEETAGPYPGDGSNGPNVLTESGIVRRDIRSSFGGLSGTADGVPLDVELTVVDAASGAALPGAAVYLWHCTADGAYSLYSQGVTDQNFLRGVQEADDGGTLRFTTVFPGAYDGRYPHMHFEVFADLATATAAGTRSATSQLALPQDVCEEVYAADEAYAASAGNLARTPLDADMVFSDGYDLQLATVAGDLSSGLTARLTVPV
jgi:protocatechuate 3,4-dioxygenase beta subunit